MVFIPVADTVLIRAEGTVDGQQTINDMYFRHTTGPVAQADIQALATNMAFWYGSTLAALLNEAWTGTKITARDLTAAVGFVAEASMVGTTGGVTGEAAPNNCSMAVSFRTALSGRSYRGRNYIPVLSNSQVAGNNIDPTWIADVLTAYQALIFGGGALPGGWVWVVVSKFSGGLPRVTGLFNEVFSVTVTDTVVDSQRRRLPGRGN